MCKRKSPDEKRKRKKATSVGCVRETPKKIINQACDV